MKIVKATFGGPMKPFPVGREVRSRDRSHQNSETFHQKLRFFVPKFGNVEQEIIFCCATL
jgi:hypothetical protein